MYYGSIHHDRIFQSFRVDLVEHMRFALLKGSFSSLSVFLIRQSQEELLRIWSPFAPAKFYGLKACDWFISDADGDKMVFFAM